MTDSLVKRLQSRHRQGSLICGEVASRIEELIDLYEEQCELTAKAIAIAKASQNLDEPMLLEIERLRAVLISIANSPCNIHCTEGQRIQNVARAALAAQEKKDD